MPSKAHYRSASKFANHSAKYASKAIVGLGRWAATDHTGSAKYLANMPKMGFIDTITMVLVHLLCTLLGAVLSAILIFLLIGYVLPALLLM